MTVAATATQVADQPGWIKGEQRADGLAIDVGGSWTFEHASALDRRRTEIVGAAGKSGFGSAHLDLTSLDVLDTAGAWLLYRLERQLADRGLKVTVETVDRRHSNLLDEVRRLNVEAPADVLPPNAILHVIATLGQATIGALVEGGRLLSFFGETMLVLMATAFRPARLRLTSVTHHLEQTCLNALPIVGLIAFLIGIVMAYQGADQLTRFGAEIYTVNLVAVSVLREIGILLTAIVVAGRSGSAFTAEIGAMKVNQEIDALRTLGLDPIEVLVLPRMIALMIALPLLAFFADILGLIGGGLMAWFVLDITPGQFLIQFESAIGPTTFWVGIVKAPVFAFLIALVGCYEGLLVSGGADSVGRHTTKSVVIGIFLVIVFDALFSILFSYLGV